MNDTTDGYMAEIGYTSDYYPELNPLHMRLAFLNAGLQAPEIATACELGCGQGVSLGIHAAASTTQWFGNDFNPAHIAFARTLSEASGAGVRFYNEAFVDFADRADLPDFDFIALHGVWSWISDQNRAAIVTFVHRRLKPGGVLYISYNALPGYTAIEPIRHLLTEHTGIAGNRVRPIVERMAAALDFADELLATKPAYSPDSPPIDALVAELKKADPRYLAHDYFNKDWRPFHFAAMVPWLSAAQLSYACSAHYLDAVDAVNLDHAQRALLHGVEDPIFRQTVRDLMVNRRFRLDYWVKGATTLSADERARALRRERVVLSARPPELPLKMRALLALNKAGPGEAATAAILAMLADGRPRTLGEIETAVAGKDVTLDQIVEMILLHVHYGCLALAQDQATAAKVRTATDRLNGHLIAGAANGSDVRCLASPLTGGGIVVSRVKQRFLQARREGKPHPDQWATAALASSTYDMAELTKRAHDFAERELPLLETLHVA
jgi:SAM-dependent methyltransferase